MDQLEELLSIHIGDHRVFILLSLLHSHHAVHQHAFHKDHIHPASGFDDLDRLQLDPQQKAHWLQMRDQLPNLQLLQEQANNFKRAKPFKDWLQSYRPDALAQKAYLAENDIPEHISLDFEDFESFFGKRKARLRQKLTKLLEVHELPEPMETEPKV